MVKPLTVKDLILDKYEIASILEQSCSYQWVKSSDKRTNKTYIMQLLLNDLPSSQLAQAFDYFDSLKNLSHQNLLTPEQVISHQKFPLIVLYPEGVYPLLKLSQDEEHNLLIDKIYQAAETLHILHNKGLIHGRISCKSFVIKNEKVCLGGFGYAPILSANNIEAIKDCEELLIPELLNSFSSHSTSLVNPLTDSYCFAKTVANWLPSITVTSWYLKATSFDPSQRFAKMGELFSQLEKTLVSLFSPQTKIIDLPPQMQLYNNKGGLILKHSLEIKVEPPEAGRVIGNGIYSEGKEVKIEALAFPDWQFIGWQGDIIDNQKTFCLVISKDLHLTAQFQKIPKSSANITITIIPVEAREFVKVNGAGNYPLGTTLHIQAWTISEPWYFSKWEGDINSSSNPLIITVNNDREITAKFEILPSFIDSRKLGKTQPGNAFIESQETKINDPLPSPVKVQPLVGKAFNVDKNENNQQSQPEQLFNNQSNKFIGKAFSEPEKEENTSSHNPENKKSNKPIIGTAFDV